MFPLSLRPLFWSDAVVKFAVSLLVLCAFSLAACNTLVTRRDLYAPTKGTGPYTYNRIHGGPLPKSNLPRRPVEPPGGEALPPEPEPESALE